MRTTAARKVVDMLDVARTPGVQRAEITPLAGADELSLATSDRAGFVLSNSLPAQ